MDTLAKIIISVLALGATALLCAPFVEYDWTMAILSAIIVEGVPVAVLWGAE